MQEVINTAGDPPLRQLTRLRSEMHIATAQFTAELFPTNPMLGMEFAIAARVCLADWTRGATVARPREVRRGIAVRKLALSLGNSPESTRRHCNQLIDLGVLTASPLGVTLAPTEANEALVRRYYLAVHDRFVRLIEDVSATCDLIFPTSGPPAFGITDVIERSLDVLLQPVDTFRLAGTSRVGHLLWGALAVVAVRRVTYDPVLCRLYGNSIPPDEVRSAISLRRLAASLAVPYATAWRQAQALEAKGLAARAGVDAWTVLQANLLAKHVQAIGLSPTRLLLPKLRELALLGLDPARAAEHYRLGRPPLADLGAPAPLAQPPEQTRGLG